MNHSYNRLPDGRAVSTSRMADTIIERIGYDFVMLECTHVVKNLWDNSKDQS